MFWQADFYRRPLKDEQGQPLWELLICDADGGFQFAAFCPQSAANSSWLVSQFQQANQGKLPKIIQVFRPQSLSLIEIAAGQLNITVEPTRRTNTLKQLLQQRAKEYPQFSNYTKEAYQALELDKPPPVPLPENLWGEQWRFATLPAGDIQDAFAERPIPYLEMPEFLLPINLGIASTTPIPGVVIYAGRLSIRLASWIAQSRPVSLNYIPGAPDGLILEAGLIDRWVVATFEDEDVSQSAKIYEQRKQVSQGLHFLLVQPDDSGMTYSGLWLLQA
jgi:RNA-binding protein Tab2/Atab2